VVLPAIIRIAAEVVNHIIIVIATCYQVVVVFTAFCNLIILGIAFRKMAESFVV